MKLGNIEITELDTSNCMPLVPLIFNPRKCRFEYWSKQGLDGWHNYTGNQDQIRMWLKYRYSVVLD